MIEYKFSENLINGNKIIKISIPGTDLWVSGEIDKDHFDNDGLRNYLIENLKYQLSMLRQ